MTFTRAASVTSLARAYELVEARHDRECCALFRARSKEFVGALFDVDGVNGELGGLQLANAIRGHERDEALPAYARRLPWFSAPILLVASDPAMYADAIHENDRVLARPITLPAITVAINDWLLAQPERSLK